MATTSVPPDASTHDAAADVSADVTLTVCRPPLWRGSFGLASTAATVLLVSSIVDVVPKWFGGRPLDQDSLFGLGLCALWGTVLALGYARRWWVRRRPLPPIVFGRAGVQLPRDPEGRGAIFVPYDDILTVGQSERPYISTRWPGSAQGANRPQRRGAKTLHAWHHFFVETPKRTISIPQPMFCAGDGHETFFYQLQRRISQRPQGLATLRATEQLRRPALVALRRRPLATQVLFGVAAVLFLNSWLKGALSTPFGLLRWGAMAPALVGQHGELYRLLAASFLHGHWLHAAMNALALSYLGTLLERLLGWQRMVLLYLCCGAFAMACSAYAADALMSVGASGALFGLLGAFAWLSWRMGPALPLGVRQPWRWWTSLLVINALVPLVWPVVDWVAHLSGFVCGVAMMAALQGRRRALLPPPGRVVWALCGVAVVCQSLALGQAVWRAAKTSADGETYVAGLLLRDPRTPAATLHNFAWLWAVERGADEAHLAAGRDCAAEAVRRAPRVPAYRATLADLERRLGEVDAATADWAQALGEVLVQMPYVTGSQGTDTVAAPYAFELVHLLHQRLPAPVAAPMPGPQPAPAAVALDSRPLQAQRRGRAWVLDWPTEAVARPREAYLLARNGDAAVALVIVELPAQPPTPWEVPEGLRDVLEGCGAESLQLAYVRDGSLDGAKGCPDACWRSWRVP